MKEDQDLVSFKINASLIGDEPIITPKGLPIFSCVCVIQS